MNDIWAVTCQSLVELAVEAPPVRYEPSHAAKGESTVFAEDTVGREELIDFVPSRLEQFALGIDDDVLTPRKDVARV